MAEHDPYCGQKPFNGHLPTPWTIWENSIAGQVAEDTADIVCLAPVRWESAKQWEQHAAFIKEAAETYYPHLSALQAYEIRERKLREALGKVVDFFDRPDVGDVEFPIKPGFDFLAVLGEARALLSGKED